MGKSTVVAAAFEQRQLEAKMQKKRVVYSVQQGNSDAACIGDGRKSCTLAPNIFNRGGNTFVDMPGMFDAGGFDISMGISVALYLLLRYTKHTSYVLAVSDYGTIKMGGAEANEWVQVLEGMCAGSTDKSKVGNKVCHIATKTDTDPSAPTKTVDDDDEVDMEALNRDIREAYTAQFKTPTWNPELKIVNMTMDTLTALAEGKQDLVSLVRQTGLQAVTASAVDMVTCKPQVDGGIHAQFLHPVEVECFGGVFDMSRSAVELCAPTIKMLSSRLTQVSEAKVGRLEGTSFFNVLLMSLDDSDEALGFVEAFFRSVSQVMVTEGRGLGSVMSPEINDLWNLKLDRLRKRIWKTEAEMLLCIGCILYTFMQKYTLKVKNLIVEYKAAEYDASPLEKTDHQIKLKLEAIGEILRTTFRAVADHESDPDSIIQHYYGQMKEHLREAPNFDNMLGDFEGAAKRVGAIFKNYTMTEGGATKSTKEVSRDQERKTAMNAIISQVSSIGDTLIAGLEHFVHVDNLISKNLLNDVQTAS